MQATEEAEEMNTGELLRDEAHKSRTLEIIQTLEDLAKEEGTDKETVEKAVKRIKEEYLKK